MLLTIKMYPGPVAWSCNCMRQQGEFSENNLTCKQAMLNLAKVWGPHPVCKGVKTTILAIEAEPEPNKA